MIAIMIRNKSMPVTRVTAIVVRTRQQDWQIDVPASPDISVESMVANRVGDALGQERLVTVAEWSHGFVTFQTADGEIELAVPDQVFEATQQGDRGLLVYQGERFIHFVRNVGASEDSSSARPGEP